MEKAAVEPAVDLAKQHGPYYYAHAAKAWEVPEDAKTISGEGLTHTGQGPRRLDGDRRDRGRAPMMNRWRGCVQRWRGCGRGSPTRRVRRPETSPLKKEHAFADGEETCKIYIEFAAGELRARRTEEDGSSRHCLDAGVVASFERRRVRVVVVVPNAAETTLAGSSLSIWPATSSPSIPQGRGGEKSRRRLAAGRPSGALADARLRRARRLFCACAAEPTWPSVVNRHRRVTFAIARRDAPGGTMPAFCSNFVSVMSISRDSGSAMCFWSVMGPPPFMTSAMISWNLGFWTMAITSGSFISLKTSSGSRPPGMAPSSPLMASSSSFAQVHGVLLLVEHGFRGRLVEIVQDVLAGSTR